MPSTPRLHALRHIWITKRGHPEELFMELSRLAGALCTFALDSHPRTLPVYDHDDPTECFAALDRHIRTHLEIILPTNCLQIRLEKTANYFYEGEVADSRCLGRSRWVFGIRSDAGEAEIITEPRKSSRSVPASSWVNWSGAQSPGWN